MHLCDILASVAGRSVSVDYNPAVDVRAGFAADLMSDALRYDLSGALLVSGLATPQLVRTAEMADVAAILLVRGKTPPREALDLADELGIPFLSTELTMFEACGRLAAAGLAPCGQFNTQT